MTEFESLVQRTHEAGLKVIIDIVANHIFRQYHSDVKPEGVEDFGQNDDTTKAFDPQTIFITFRKHLLNYLTVYYQILLP